MGRNAERDMLLEALSSHRNIIHETLRFFDQTPASTLKKVSWDEVVKMGDQVYKQATIAGMLCTGKGPQASEVEENMKAYFNMLVGFLLLSHGSTVGAGPTLSCFIHQAVQKIADCSYKLFKEPISSFGKRDENEGSIPQLVGAVWEACSALEKTPTTNIAAIGRVMTRVAVSLKDVLREMKELKPASMDSKDETSDQTSTKAESEVQDNDGFSENDLGNDLSPEEMEVTQSAIAVVSEALVVVKELMRSITGLLKLESRADTGDFVDSLEELLKHCKEIGAQIDEIGAALYPPQEVDLIKAAVEKISSLVGGMEKEIESLQGTSESFLQACSDLKNSLTQLKSELDCSEPLDLADEMKKVDLDN